MGDDDDGLPFSVQRLENREDLLGRAGVEVSGRLVAEDHHRVVDDGAGNGDALLLTSRKLVRAVFHALPQTDFLQSQCRDLVAVLHAGVLQREFDIAKRALSWEEVELLEHEADVLVPDLGELVLIEVGDVLAVQKVHPAGGLVKAPEGVHKGRLPGTGWPHDRDKFALLDGERHVTQRVHHDVSLAVVLAEVFDVDDSVAHGFPGVLRLSGFDKLRNAGFWVGVRRVLAAFDQTDLSGANSPGLPRQVAGKKPVTSLRTPTPSL